MHFRSQVYNTEFSFKSTMSWTFHKRHRLKLIENGGNKWLCVLLTTQKYLTWLRRNISMSFLNLSARQNFSLVMETEASNLSFFFLHSLLHSQNPPPFPSLLTKTRRSGGCTGFAPAGSASCSFCSLHLLSK